MRKGAYLEEPAAILTVHKSEKAENHF